MPSRSNNYALLLLKRTYSVSTDFLLVASAIPTIRMNVSKGCCEPQGVDCQRRIRVATLQK
jgi:hypothetical protein